MKYRSIIIKDSYINIVKSFDETYNKLSNDGSIFYIFQNEYYKNGEIKHDIFSLVSFLIEKDLYLVNIIVFPSRNISKHLADNVNYIIWVCKDKNNYFFNKDSIREKSIWKDVEWGHREKNYNPLGKDPTNVWIPTEDDGKGNITKHHILSIKKIADRLINMTESKDKVYLKLSRLSAIPIHYRKLKANCIKSKILELYFNSSEKMKIKSNTIQLVFTSPPYWDLKDYYKKGQIGQETYDIYLKRLKKVYKECYRVLNSNGTFCININTRTIKGEPYILPNDFIKICKDIGFHYKGIIIWHKSSGIPTSDMNLSDHFEYVLIFSKGKNLYINGSYSDYNDYHSKMLTNSFFWNINRKAGSVGKKYVHPAIFPNELAERIIDVFSVENDVVLDPFIGSGTTMIAAIKQNRSCVGYEYNEKFESLIKNRIENDLQNIDLSKIKIVK